MNQTRLYILTSNLIKLAWKMGRYRTAQTWKIISMFYSDTDQEIEETLKESFPDTDIVSLLVIQSVFVFTHPTQNTTLEEYSEDNGSVIKEEVFETSSQSCEGDEESLNTSNSSNSPASFNLRLPWQHESVVTELLNYYTEQVRVLFILYLAFTFFTNFFFFF